MNKNDFKSTLSILDKSLILIPIDVCIRKLRWHLSDKNIFVVRQLQLKAFDKLILDILCRGQFHIDTEQRILLSKCFCLAMLNIPAKMHAVYMTVWLVMKEICSANVCGKQFCRFSSRSCRHLSIGGSEPNFMQPLSRENCLPAKLSYKMYAFWLVVCFILLTRKICSADFFGYQPNFHTKCMHFGW